MKGKIVKNFWSQRIKEISGISLMLFALFFTVSLLTYHPLDASFNSAFDAIIANKGGKIGAVIASFALEFFGLANLFIIIFMLSWSVFLFRKDPPEYVSMRLISFALALLSACFFLSYFNTSYSWEFVSYGGIVGFYLSSIFKDFFSINFLTFISLITFLILFCYSQSISYIQSLKTAKKFTFFIATKSFYYLQKTPALAKKIYSSAKLLLEKRFFKKRIKDIDPTLYENKDKVVTIEKANIPELKKISNYALPKLTFLSKQPVKKNVISKEQLAANAKRLQNTLEDFGINGKILDVKPGPVVTLYEFEPAAGVKSSRIIGLADDVARSMSAISARISVLSGQNALGIELPNEDRETVFFRGLMECTEYNNQDINLPLALGKNIGGESIVADLAKMPHLLVAGTTGSGKSVAINTMILSILYRMSPKECKFIMVDPKMLELSVYDGIPHLLSPVVTEPKKAVQVLRWMVQEMENRYRLMSSLGVRNVAGYNSEMEKAIKEKRVLTRTVQTGFNQETGKPIFEEVELDMQPLPYIVLIIDEMADLMLVAGKEIESYIQRLAQMARAAGIHIIIATQRPSVDVITGVIKANFPTRISFQVTSKIDSRTILGEQGAEQLLGMGDMLYMYGGSKITRVHGAFCSDKEVGDIVKFLKKQGEPVYINNMFSEEGASGDNFAEGGENSDKDELYDKAVNIVLNDKKASISYIQRQLRIGYNRAANIIEEMEQAGVVSPAGPTGKREILSEN